MSTTSKLTSRVLTLVFVVCVGAICGLGRADEPPAKEEGESGAVEVFDEVEVRPSMVNKRGTGGRKEYEWKEPTTKKLLPKNPDAAQRKEFKVEGDETQARYALKKNQIKFEPVKRINPATGKEITDDEGLKTKSGKVIPAKDYFAELNAMERFLNSRGQSLDPNKVKGSNVKTRGKPGVIREELLQKNDSDVKKQEQKAKRILARHNALNPNKVRSDKENSLKGGLTEKQQRQAARLEKQQLKKLENGKISDSSRWHNSLGKHDTVGLDLTLEGEYSGTYKEQRVRANASAVAWLWNKQTTIVQAEVIAKVDLPSSFRTPEVNFACSGQDVSANVLKAASKFTKKSNGGTKNKAKNSSKSKPKESSKNKDRNKNKDIDKGKDSSENEPGEESDEPQGEEKDFSQTIDYSVSFRYVIGPVPVSVRLGISGTLGLRYDISFHEACLSSEITPYARIEVYAEAAIDAWIIKVGVGCALTLINADLTITANVGYKGHSDEKLAEAQPYLEGHLEVKNKITMLSGRVYIFLEIFYLFGRSRWDWEIFAWKGLELPGKHLVYVNKRKNLFSGSEEVSRRRERNSRQSSSKVSTSSGRMRR